MIWDQNSYDYDYGPKESELNFRAFATLLKAVCCFLQLNRGLKLGNRNFEKYCEQSGLLDSIISSFESLERLDYPFDFFWNVVLVFDPIPVEIQKFSDYQRKVVAINFHWIDWSYYRFRVFIGEYLLITLDVWVWTSYIICSYCVISSYYPIIIVFFDGEKLSVRNYSKFFARHQKPPI